MISRDTSKSLKINIKKRIGTVVIVVEGATYEFELFDWIFRKICIMKRYKAPGLTTKYASFLTIQ